MTNAAITGWGACMPPAVLTNADLATFLDTDDAWIASRTGMKERRISHVPAIEMATVAPRRAIACAGLEPADIDLVLYGSCSNGEQVPNSASGVQAALGATRAAAMDINTACTSFLYSLSTASAMIRTGIVRRAVVIGVELISPYMDWRNRNVAVLFGDGCAAVVLEPAEGDEGLLGEQLGCDADGRASLRVRGIGCVYANRDVAFGDTLWDFNGQEIFRRAVRGMSQASVAVLARISLLPSRRSWCFPRTGGNCLRSLGGYTLMKSAVARCGVTPVRLEFPILSLHPGLRQRCVVPDVWPTLSRA